VNLAHMFFLFPPVTNIYLSNNYFFILKYTLIVSSVHFIHVHLLTSATIVFYFPVFIQINVAITLECVEDLFLRPLLTLRAYKHTHFLDLELRWRLP
jgi:hypothetical protein